MDAHQLAGYLSIMALSLLAVFCTVGIAHKGFADTLTQRIGLAAIAIWCISRVLTKIEEPHTEPVHLWLHMGMLFYGIGVALKIYRAMKAKNLDVSDADRREYISGKMPLDVLMTRNTDRAF